MIRIDGTPFLKTGNSPDDRKKFGKKLHNLAMTVVEELCGYQPWEQTAVLRLAEQILSANQCRVVHENTGSIADQVQAAFEMYKSPNEVAADNKDQHKKGAPWLDEELSKKDK